MRLFQNSQKFPWLFRLFLFIGLCLFAFVVTYKGVRGYTIPLSFLNPAEDESVITDPDGPKDVFKSLYVMEPLHAGVVMEPTSPQAPKETQKPPTTQAPSTTQLTHTTEHPSVKLHKLSSQNVKQNLPRKHRYIKDKYHTAYIPYLKGIYKPNHRCIDASNEVYRHNFTYSPNFSCKSQIPTLTKSERKIKTRQQLRIWCEGEKSLGAVETVSWDTPLQTFSDNASRACLSSYIRQNCYDDYPIPNIVHWLYFADGTLDLRKAVPFYSVFSILRPCLVLLHGNHFLPGPYWDALIPHAPILVHVPRSPQTHIHGRKIVHVANQADIARLEVLQEFGGLYLDNDEIILRPVDIFRATGFAAFIEGQTNLLANGIMFARPNHEITKIWLKNYDTYDGVSWSSHSIGYLTTLPAKHPDLIQEFGPLFVRFDWQTLNNLYVKSCSLGNLFGQHLYRASYPKNVDLQYLKTANTTYGRLARYVLFGDARVCT